MSTTNEPDVVVTDVEKIKTKTYGNAGKIACIGAFPSTTFSVKSYTKLEDAQSDLGVSPLPEGCVSYGCLPYLFNQNDQSKGAEEVIIVNTNYGAGSASYTITNELLASALLLLADEDFDILVIADSIDLEAAGANSSVIVNPIWNTLKTFVDSQYRNQQPFGIITAIDIDNTSETGDATLASLKQLFHDKGIYKAVTTPVHERNDTNALTKIIIPNHYCKW